MIVGIKTKFDAAHYLPNYSGKCKEMHGHTWTVEVEVEGWPDSSGMVTDFATLRRLVQQVVEPFDHHILNETLEHPTCENVATYLRGKLIDFGLLINKVKVQEGDGGWSIV